MLSSEALIATDRAERYLQQLCGHLAQIQGRHLGGSLRVEHDRARGLIDLGTARCELLAIDGGLHLRALATNEASLRDIQTRVAGRLQKIGRRDRLTVNWSPAAAKPDSD